MVKGGGRFSSTQLNTRILGDLEVTGKLTVSGSGGGGSVDLSDYQKHASAHLAAYGMESYYAANNVDFYPNPPWDHYLSWGNFTHVCNNERCTEGQTLMLQRHGLSLPSRPVRNHVLYIS